MFVHLIWHSHYSLLEWVWNINKIVWKAKTLWMNAISITDTWAMYWALEFYKAAKKSEIKPIIWLEIAIVEDISKKEVKDENNYITLIAKNIDGYQNLMEIVSVWNLYGFQDKPRIDIKTLKKFCNWNLVIFWENSQLAKIILSNENKQKAIEIINIYKEIFWNEWVLLSITAQDYKLERYLETINNWFIKLSEETNITLVVNNNFHYIDRSDKQAYETLLCIKEWIQFYDKNRKKILWDYHIMDENEIIIIMKANWFDDEMIQKLIENNSKIAESIDINIKLWNILFPKYESPSEIKKLYEENKDNLIV